MSAQLELEWLGGPAARRLRRQRPGIDELPWGTLAAVPMPEEEAAAARLAWTDGAFREYASAAGFAALSTALLEAGAPIDLVAMSADFVVDEMLHVELNARVAAELGGAAPYHVELEKVSPRLDASLPAIERAAELALVTSCIGEALSVPSLVGSMFASSHPLVRAVLARIVRDEAPHARIGFLVLDWAGEAVDRGRLGRVARDRIAAYAPLFEPTECEEAAPALRSVAGWMSDEDTRLSLSRALAERVVRPLEARGITV